MNTLQDIIKNIETEIKGCVGTDASTPEGHFQLTAKVQGKVRIYLLEGTLNDPEAVIKGNIEMSKDYQHGIAYRGNDLSGGNMLGFLIDSPKNHFALMAS